MAANYPTYKYTEDDAKNQLARLVRLDNPDSYPFDNFHAHAYNEILVFTKGGGRHNINFRTYAVEDNSVHLLAAQDLHWLERSMESEGFAIVYKDQFLQKLQMVHPDIHFHQLFDHSKVINLNEQEAEEFAFIFREILGQSAPSAYQLQIIGAFLTKVASLGHQTIPSGKIYDPIVGLLILHIEKHFRTKKQVDDYARLLSVTSRTLQNRIKKASGLTVSEIIQERILKEAKKLLCISDMNIGEIAFELGFNETPHFTNWFKRKTGYLPSDYKYGN
ncbi:MAG: helix-turn-helix transcriptional regulator [Taibaiella sp.]|nr:helix-turn-helix transcriptional regulator [Taibaiella sp.]